MNVLAHHFMGGHTGNLLLLLRSQELVRQSHGYSSINLDTRAHLLFSLVPPVFSFLGAGTSSIEMAGEEVRPSSRVGGGRTPLSRLLLFINYP